MVDATGAGLHPRLLAPQLPDHTSQSPPRQRKHRRRQATSNRVAQMWAATQRDQSTRQNATKRTMVADGVGNEETEGKNWGGREAARHQKQQTQTKRRRRKTRGHSNRVRPRRSRNDNPPDARPSTTTPGVRTTTTPHVAFALKRWMGSAVLQFFGVGRLVVQGRRARGPVRRPGPLVVPAVRGTTCSVQKAQEGCPYFLLFMPTGTGKSINQRHNVVGVE